MDNLPDDMLRLILCKVATNGHHDLQHISMVCKHLKEVGLDRDVFRALSLQDFNTSPSGHISYGMDLFLQRLYDYQNPVYYMRVGVELLHKSEVDAATTLFDKAAMQEHDYAVYAYASVLVLWNEALFGEGFGMLRSLYDRGFLFTARNAFWEKVSILGWFWVKPRLEYNPICKASGACGGVSFICGTGVPESECHLRTSCVNCRIDAEIQLFLLMIRFTYEVPIDHCISLAFYPPNYYNSGCNHH